MKLLILTQYYPPEIGAPQNRLHELAVRLKDKGINVEVLTALPNYPEMEIQPDYQNKKKRIEIIDGVQVYRSWIYVSKSKNIISRLLNYFSFVWTSYWKGRTLGDYDFLLVESPPLFLGYSAMALSKKLNSKLIFNVSDLWPESAEKMGIVTNKTLLKIAYNLEKKCYKKAKLITGQTQGIVDSISARFPDKNIMWLPNGVDISFYNPDKINQTNFRKLNNYKDDDVIFFYGGILGYAQGLEIIIKTAELLKGRENIKFVIQGSGPEKEKLIKLKDQCQTKNVSFLDPVPKSMMPGILKAIDVAVIPLKKLDLFKGAIPSKIFEASAMKKALLLGVDGEAKKHFIENGKSGLYFTPEDHESLKNQILFMADNPKERNQMGENARNYVSSFFNRNKIASDLFDKLQNQ